jgi:flagellum-specific peptidoglycan hydrolase FlgJ
VNAQQNAFLQAIVSAAQATQRRWGVPASVTIAQAILESSSSLGWGKSQLATLANNFFGIKALHAANPDTYVEFDTREFVNGLPQIVKAKFERYGSMLESFDDHGRLLATAPRYASAMAVREDPESFCIQLQHCGYSTSSSYAVTLLKLIHEYDLTQYDVPPPNPAAEAAVEAA